MRLTLTRGEKVTSGMSPTNNQGGCTLIVLAEWKGSVDSSGKPQSNAAGTRLISSTIRRNTPSCLDSKIHHNNLLNNILAKIEANVAGVDDALMLDMEGFASETNATNIFFVKRGAVLTPHADACLPGITRRKVIALARSLGLEATERRVSIAEVYAADEMFTTGTMGELVPVVEVDGRRIGSGFRGPVTAKLQEAYSKLTANEGMRIPRE
jgi:branched-subunit amino acid aminotransferase/4-amino-4-deoxychorismate lyase